MLDGVLSSYRYSLAVLAMVWAPVKFAAGRDLAVHVVDIISLSLLSFLSFGAMSPVCVYFTFLFICGTLRWHSRGAFWTAVSAISAYPMMSVYVAFGLELPTPEWGAFANRSVHLAAIAGLIGCMAASSGDTRTRSPASLPAIRPPALSPLVGRHTSDQSAIAARLHASGGKCSHSGVGDSGPNAT